MFLFNFCTLYACNRCYGCLSRVCLSVALVAHAYALLSVENYEQSIRHFNFTLGNSVEVLFCSLLLLSSAKIKKIKTKTLGVWFYSCQQVHFNRNNLKFCNSHGLRFIWELRMNMLNGKTPETNFTLIIHAFFDFDNKLLTPRSTHSSLSWAKTFALNPIQVHLIMQFISILFYFQQRRHLPSLLPVPNGVI